MAKPIRPTLALAGILVALLLAAVPPAASAQSPTFSRSDHPLVSHNVAADFNGDGALDIAGSRADAGAVKLNNGSGAFGPHTEFPIASCCQALAAADFNGDGALDLALTVNAPDTSFALLMGNGDGTFDPAVLFPNTTGSDSPAIVATDLNNDGRQDLAIAHQLACFTAPCRATELMSILLGNGDGTFQPSRDIQVGRGIAAIAVGDFNRDGIRDLAMAGDSSRVYRLQGAGDGTFVQQPTITLTADTFGVDGTDVDVADFNRDGIEDLVVAIALNGSRTAILIGNGDGSFRAPLILTDSGLNVPQVIAVGDYNGDGFQDLALGLANGNQGLMQIRNGNGDGTFQAPVQFLVPPDQSSVGTVGLISAQLNADTRPDLALAQGGAFHSLLVLLNTTSLAPPPTPSAPSLLSPAQDASPSQPVAFDWTDVSGATAYRIQIDDSSNFSTPLVADRVVTASQFTASTLAERRHWWRVRGINSAGVAGAWSSVRRFTPRAATTAPAPAALSSLSVSPSSVTGGSSSQGTVTLTSAAPAGGFAVSLSSSNAAATVPASVSVAQGATSATFPIATTAVSTSTPVTITASAGAVSRTATLTVAPPGQAATLTVTATGRSGERVTSSPTGINVAVGSTGSASFTTGTVITLSVTNSRDAIWSGACSSGGNKAKTCTFTLNGNASVSANVQ